jgi:PEP-CTERM motif-containing protein
MGPVEASKHGMPSFLGDRPSFRSRDRNGREFVIVPDAVIAARRHVNRAIFLLLALSSAAVGYGQSTIWITSGAGNFVTAGNWTNGVPNNSINASITNGTSGTPTDVMLSGAPGSVQDLTLSSFNTLDLGLNSSLSVAGTSITNNGALNVTAGSGNNTFLELTNNVVLSGTGALTLSYGDHNGNAYVEQSGGSYSLTNSASTIQGDGIIGNGSLTFVNSAGGTVNANVSSQSLTMNGTGGISNAGLLEASGGGILVLSSNVANTGGNITASSGTVNVSATITGGTLNTSGTGVVQTSASAELDAVTIASSSTYTGSLGTTTALDGAITNNGTLQLISGSGNNTFLYIDSNTTLQGGGTVTLNSGDTNGFVYVQENGSNLTLTNVDNQVQGYGDIGNSGLTLVNSAGGVVNANVASRTLTLDGTGGVTNTGLLEATGGGALQISAAVNNLNGNITANAGTVNVSSIVQGGTLNSANGGTLQTSGTSTLDGASQGPLTISAASTYTGGLNTMTSLMGMIVDQGNLQLNAGSATNTFLNIVANTTLQGGGTLTLNSGDDNGHAFVQQTGGNYTLTNEITVQGYGVIGNGSLTLINESGSTIDANVPLQTLTVNPSGGFTNPGGTLEASNGGTLALSSSVIDNAGGTIEVNGASSVVQFVNGVTIQGGTLTSLSGGTIGVPGTSITLDGSTEGAITLSAGSTYSGALNTNTTLLGTIINNGNFQLTAGSANNTALDMGANTMLVGGGTVTLDSGDDNGQVWVQQSVGGVTLTNVDNIFEGYGIIGHGGLAFTNDAAGTVDANASGQTLLLNGSGNVINNGLLEATSGGILQITNVIGSPAGNITANGGTVLINGGATIQGGTLNSLNGGILGTGTGDATLDGSANPITLSSGSTWTGGLSSQTSLLGTITNHGSIQLGAGSGNNTYLLVAANTTLQGGGTVVLNSGDNNGQVYVQQQTGPFALTNVDNTIQGYGDIGHGGLALINAGSGTIDADSTNNTLLLDGSGNITNSGTLEATNGGNLQISTIVSNSGNVSSNGGTVDIVGGTIQGGTLIGTALETTGTATLDGTTNGALLLSSGSQYTGGLSTTTNVFGAIIDQGNIQLDAGSGNNTFLEITANTTLTGGGTVTLNSGDNNGQVYIQQSTGGVVLTNSGDVIEGYGIIGNGGLTLFNSLAGIIDANAPGQTLQINASGTVTNNGTFEGDQGILSLVSEPSNLSGNTLTGGTWIAADGGTVSFESTSNAIVVNDATLILDGPGSEIQTKTGAGNTYQQLEQTLTTNDGTLEVTSNRNFAASNGLSNSGLIQLGGGTLTAPSLANNPGGTLAGFGTFSPTGGVSIASGSQVSPGSAVTGQWIATLSFGTPLNLGAGGAYAFDLKNAPSAVAGTDYDTVNVSGALSVSATPGSPFSIDLRSVNPGTGNLGLANFNSTQSYSWTLVSAGSISGFNSADFSINTSAFQNSLNGGSLLVGENGNSLTLNFTPVPEPGTWSLMILGVGALSVAISRRSQRTQAHRT